MRNPRASYRRTQITEEWYGTAPPVDADPEALDDVEDLNREEQLDHDLDGADDVDDLDDHDLDDEGE